MQYCIEDIIVLTLRSDSLIKIAVGGARGRVGRCIVELAEKDPQTQLIAAVIRANTSQYPNQNPNLIQKSGERATLETASPEEGQASNDTPYYLGLASLKLNLDVFIDFSGPEALAEHLKLCSERKQSMVIGVTGLNEAHKAQLIKASKIIPIVYSPNMSIGINVTFKLLQVAAEALNENVGVSIHEIHRLNKKDAPSGTALVMSEIIANAWGKDLPIPEINMASSRVGDIRGEHTVLFALEDERLEIIHRAENRMSFARGAIRAAKWVVHQSPGLYDMQDVLSLKGYN